MASSMAIKKSTIPAQGQKRVDHHTQSYSPLDFSFHNAEKLEGKSTKTNITLFYWVFSILDALAMEPRVNPGGSKLIRVGDRYQSLSINLNHNMLNSSLEILPSFVQKTLLFPDALTSLDLSFNVFTEIPKVNFLLTSILIIMIDGISSLDFILLFITRRKKNTTNDGSLL